MLRGNLVSANEKLGQKYFSYRKIRTMIQNSSVRIRISSDFYFYNKSYTNAVFKRVLRKA